MKPTQMSIDVMGVAWANLVNGRSYDKGDMGALQAAAIDDPTRRPAVALLPCDQFRISPNFFTGEASVPCANPLHCSRCWDLRAFGALELFPWGTSAAAIVSLTLALADGTTRLQERANLNKLVVLHVNYIAQSAVKKQCLAATGQWLRRAPPVLCASPQDDAVFSVTRKKENPVFIVGCTQIK